MSNWNPIKEVALNQLNLTRKALHQAVQIIGAAPRNVLDPDPSDTSASLEWNDSLGSLLSIPLNKGGDEIRVALSFKDFSIQLLKNDQVTASSSLSGTSTLEALSWAKVQLTDEGLAGEKINLDLPYEIEDYDYSKMLSVDEDALQALLALYSNTNALLEKMVTQWKDAYEIRCWPHHFDLATLIPLETDSKGEILRSIGIGLSPGDDGVHEPYIYVNIWPNVEGLDKHPLTTGHWNQEGWTGAVLTYSELLKAKNQEEALNQFCEQAIGFILKETERD